MSIYKEISMKRGGGNCQHIIRVLIRKNDEKIKKVM